MAEIADLLGHAFDKNPVDFSDAFSQIMQQKAADAVAAHKVTLAQSIYAGEEPVGEDDDEFETETDTDEVDLDDDELDLDIDLADLDLDDLDLEDNEDTDEDA